MMVTKLLKQQTMMRCCSVMLVLSLCVSLFAGCSNGSTENGISTTKKETLLTTIYEDVLYIADSDGTVHTADFYGDVYSEQTSMDGSKYIAVDDDEYTLLYFNGEEILTLADNIGVAVMSADGNAVAYITLIDEENRISELYLYADGESRLIDSGAINMCAVSPDGSAVGYTTEVEDENYRSYYWDGSEIHEIGKHRVLIALSNGGEYIYYAKLDAEERSEDFYVQQGDDSATKMKLPDIDSQEVYFNRDATELMFSNGEKTYIVVKSEELVEISAEDCSPIFPEGVLQSSSEQLGPTYITYSIDSFSGSFYEAIENGAYQLIYVNQDFNTKTVAENCYANDCHFSKDEKTVFYSIYDSFESQHGTTYMFDGATPDADPVKLFDGNYPTITASGKAIFYFTDDGTLWKMDGTKPEAKPVKLGAQESAFGDPIVTMRIIEAANTYARRYYLETSIDGKTFFYINDNGEILAQTGTKEPRAITPKDAKVCINSPSNGKIFYELDGQFYCYENGEAWGMYGLEDWIDAKGLNNISIGSHDNMLIAIYSGYNSITDGYAGYYFSVDGVNFKPLVKNYNEPEPSE